MCQESAQFLQLGAYRVDLKQFLTELQIHLHESSDDVDDLAGFFQIKSCSGNALWQILHKCYQTLKVADNIALHSLGFVISFLRIWLQGDMGSKVGLLLRKFANSHTLETLHNNLNSAIRHT